MRNKPFFVFLLTMLLTVFAGAAFGAGAGKISCPQDLFKLQFQTQSKSVAKTVALGTGKISGRVIDRDGGAPIAGITVTAYPLSGDFCVVSGGSAITDENGDYTIIELAGGPYNVEFSDDTEQPVYSRQWFDNKLDEAQAAVVQVTEPNTTTNINASLDKGGSISGKVTCSSGAQISSFSISAVGTNTGYTAATTATVMSIPGVPIPLPGNDGSYTLYGLPSDTYTISFDSNYMGGADPLCIPQDSQVTIIAPEAKTNIDKTLVVGGSITGTLLDDTTGLPIQGAMVYTTAPGAGNSFIGIANFGFSDQTGAFTIGGLASGSYDVIINGRVIYDSGNPSVHKGYILLKEANVSVSSPGTKDIGTKRLVPGGKITGTVTNKSAGAPLKDVSVIGYDAATGEMISYAITDAAGVYTLTGFATGSYKVQFIACQGSYAEQWYNGKTTQAGADPVNVTAPDTTSGINGVLDLAGSSDTTPPVTTASPLGGTYATPQTVTLTANEAATIYYTTNGIDPTTASPVYSSPLTINVSTTLKYFARDTAGNSETVKSQAYVITPVVNGDCGSSNGGTFATAPTSGLCSAGTASTVEGTGPWNWSCLGSNGGTNDSCSANKSAVTIKPGDCDENGTVTIAEVQSAINMFLGINQVLLCVDTNSSGAVTIDEVQKAINGFLGL